MAMAQEQEMKARVQENRAKVAAAILAAAIALVGGIGAALLPPLETAGFKWDNYSQRWQLRLTKKFPEIFVAFLQALPAGTRE